MEGLKFGEAYLQREICVHKSIGLALWLKVNLPFWCCFTLYLRATFQVQATSPRGAYVWRGLFLEFYGILSNLPFHETKLNLSYKVCPNKILEK